MDDTLYSGTGLMVYLRFDEATCQTLEAWTRTLPVTRIVPAEKLHLTMMRNAEVFEHFASMGDFHPPAVITLTRMKLRVFQIDSGGDALTVNFASARLTRRANQIRRMLRLPKRRKQFHPHVSLAYGAGMLSKKQLHAFEERFPLQSLIATGEYMTPVQPNWARSIG